MQTGRVALLDCGPALGAWVSMGVIMTDTLRQECNKLLEELEDAPRTEYYFELFDKEAVVAKILAFARSQQAKGLREAAEVIQDSMKPGAAMPMREQMLDYLLNHAWALEHQKEAQATAREKGEA